MDNTAASTCVLPRTDAAVVSINKNKPFTRAAAIKAGMSVRQLIGPDYRRLLHGVYIGSHVKINTDVRARAALSVSASGSYISHHTAALLWGGWAPPTTQIHLSSPATKSRSERGGISSHRARELAPVNRSGVPTSPAVQVFLELAGAGLGLVDLVAVGDSLVKAKAVTPDQLTTAAVAFRGAGCRLARRAARWVREDVDSVMETRLRMLLVLAGLPEPTAGHIIRREDGSWLYRIDLCYLGLLLAVEYDGRQHAESTGQWNKDIRRREELESRGWRMVVITAEGVFDEPAETLDRVRRALIERGESAGRRQPGVEWQRCFPAKTRAVAA